MKVYIASSWKNAELCRHLAVAIRDIDIEVYCFSEDHSCNFVWSELGDVSKYDMRSILSFPQTRLAFQSDREGIDSSDCTVLVLPCGRSGHLEAGYTKGAGKILFIYASGGLRNERLENMYHFVDKIFDANEIVELLSALKILKDSKEVGRC